ncbi:cytochrome c maturation protein CcmE [Magnetococcales bacterium HHB-1]
MDKKKKNRLLLIASIVLVGGALLALVFASFNDALVYFYTTTETLEKDKTLQGERIRIGGMVQEGSLIRQKDSQKVQFLVTDGKKHISVYYQGLLPDLFREGQGVIVEGVWRGEKRFKADSILAKHSEDYVPIEMSEEGLHKSKESLLKSLQQK